jgi:hypothetical protein
MISWLVEEVGELSLKDAVHFADPQGHISLT